MRVAGGSNSILLSSQMLSEINALTSKNYTEVACIHQVDVCILLDPKIESFRYIHEYHLMHYPPVEMEHKIAQCVIMFRR